MSTSLSKLVDNFSEGLHNNRCVYCKFCLDYMKTKNEKLILRCFSCKMNYEKNFNKELIKRFGNTYNLCNGDLNKFILLLRKGVYSYEHMDNWERFDEISLPDKESFYSSLNTENIDDIDYRHGNNVFKKFKLKNLGEYHDLYVQSNTLLLADVFENLRNMCINRFWLGFFMDVKWLGGGGGKNYPPPLVISRTKQVRNMIFCMGLPCLKFFPKM